MSLPSSVAAATTGSVAGGCEESAGGGGGRAGRGEPIFEFRRWITGDWVDGDSGGGVDL